MFIFYASILLFLTTPKFHKITKRHRNPVPCLPQERGVDAMVFTLKQRFKQSGVTLPLEKQAGATYRLGSRKLQLSIRHSRLNVRLGSSYIDFLEYLSKAAL